MRPFENFKQLIALAFRGNIREQVRGFFHGFARIGFDPEIQRRGLAHRPQDSDRIIAEGCIRTGADQLGAQIRCSAQRIENTLVAKIECNGIDREVAPTQVGLQVCTAE